MRECSMNKLELSLPVNLKGLALALGISPKAARRWRRLGMPHHTLSTGVHMYFVDEVLAWLRSMPGQAEKIRRG